MKKIALILTVFLSGISFGSEGLELSYDFFQAVKENKTTATEIREKIAQLNPETLSNELNEDEKRLAFWINIYNANIQYLLKRNPALFEDRGAFFKAKQVTVAGEVLSFDLIEHGVLRRSKSKLSLGYFGKVNVSNFEKLFRVKKVDPRIHYALNCGAKSCPPISVYHAEKVNEELDQSCKAYLTENHKVNENSLEVPVLFSWFRADFGGKRGVRKFLLNYGIVTKEESKRNLVFLDYDWTLALDPYRN